MAVDVFYRLQDLEQLFFSLLSRAQVLEPILSLVDAVCMALELDPSVGNVACTGSVRF